MQNSTDNRICLIYYLDFLQLLESVPPPKTGRFPPSLLVVLSGRKGWVTLLI